jgi:HEAT repeat protein
LAALRPKRWGDKSVVHEMMVENMRHVVGAPFDFLGRAARDLGFVAADLRSLRSPNKLVRGLALESLGVMRIHEAVPDIIAILDHGGADIRLTALRALAAIGDVSALPHFLAASDRLSPPMMVRLASLMMEFGPPARVTVRQLIERHPDAFNVRTTALVLREITSREFAE